MGWRLVVVLASLLAVPVGAVPFLQYGVDAGNTGYTPDPGPAMFDTAFVLDLGTEFVRAPPLIIGESVFVLTSEPRGDPDPGPDDLTLWRLDTRTGTAKRLYGFVSDSYGTCFASDGGHLFVTGAGILIALDLDGRVQWRVDIGPTGLETDHCTAIRVVGADVYVVARADAVPWRLLKVHEGQVLWARSFADYAAAWYARAAGVRVVEPFDAGAVVRTIAIDDRGLGAFMQANPYAPQALPTASRLQLVVFDTETGDAVEMRGAGGYGLTQPEEADRLTRNLGDDTEILIANGVLYEKDRRLTVTSLDPWRAAYQVEFEPGPGRVGGIPLLTPMMGNQMVFAGGTLYAWSDWQLQVIDDASRRVVATAEPQEDFARPAAELLATPGTLYLRTGNLEDVYAVRPSDLGVEARWLSTLHGAVEAMSVGDGILVLSYAGGEFAVIGVTPAGIQPEWQAPERYPRVGEPVRLDLGRSRLGTLDGALEFSVDWGDGTTTPWTEDPVFTHAFQAAGTVETTVRLRNGDAQYAERKVTFHVGQEPPTFLSRAFAADNQETTFFILGLVLTVGIAAAGAARLRRKRRLLRREMAGIDGARALLHGARLDEALDDARQRARLHGASGRLTEAQVALLLQHAGDARRSHRLEVLEKQFGDLPHRVYRALEDILADATVSSWERDRVAEQLAAAGLPVALRRRVERQVRQWAAEDA